VLDTATGQAEFLLAPHALARLGVLDAPPGHEVHEDATAPAWYVPKGHATAWSKVGQ